MATFLVTGGAGFIGSHLAERLLGAGQDVLVLDDLSTGSERNLDHLRPNSRLEVFVDSVANEALVTELVDRSDFVFHLAAAVGVELVVRSPIHVLETNLHETEVLLKAAAGPGVPVAGIVVAGTSPLAQPPKAFSSFGKRSFIVTSPTIANIALLGR
jgi:UDP-glucose 4-epimerase